MNIFKQANVIRQKAVELNNEKRKIEDIIDLVAPDSLKVDLDTIMFLLRCKHNKDRCFDILFKEYFKPEDEQVRSFIKYLAEKMDEQDFPISIDDAKKFCDQLEVSQAERELITSKASTREQYQQYVDHERAMMNY